MGIFKKQKKQTLRQRSIAPSERDPRFSYYQNRDETERQQRGDRPYTNERKLKPKHLPTYLALLVIVGCLLYMLMLSMTPKIIVVNEQNEAVQSFLRSPDTYETAAQAAMQSSPLNKTKITINTDNVAQQLQETFPEITDIAVTLPIVGKRPVIYIRVAVPRLLLETNEDAYIIDEQGRAVVAAHEASDISKLHLLKVIDQTGLAIQANTQALPRDHMVFIETVHEQLTAKGLIVQDMTLPPLANELHVRIKGMPYFIKFTLVGDGREQVGTYLAVKQRFDQEKISPTEYVDVRVTERAYYK